MTQKEGQVDYIQASILKKTYERLKKWNKKNQKLYILLSEIVEKFLKEKGIK